MVLNGNSILPSSSKYHCGESLNFPAVELMPSIHAGLEINHWLIFHLEA